MFHSVLVPLDGSPFSERALPLAEMVGRVAGTRLHLVSVEDPASAGSDKERYLTDLAQRLKDADIEVDHIILGGKVVDAIEDRAKQVGADLVVMVTHGRSGLERWRLGSVAEGLVSKAIV